MRKTVFWGESIVNAGSRCAPAYLSLSSGSSESPTPKSARSGVVRMDGWMDGRMDDGRTDGRKISPFYRTSSPIGAAAPLQPNFNPKTIKRGKGTAVHMMPLGDWFFSFLFGFSLSLFLFPLTFSLLFFPYFPFLGSGPDRGQSPVEWGDFPSVRTSVRPSVRPPPLGPKSQPGRL